LIVSGKGAEILKTAEILDKGNASGTYGKFVQEANAEYQRIYGKDKNLAKECDFYPVSIKKECEDDFFTGKFLKSKCFSEEILPENRYAVFTEEGDFCGEVYLENRKIKYGFVIPKEILA
ncbi:MAG: hypothetical protein UIH41_04885, partial [Treponemataceae bacterium]|nr:hypothetical protein [Treponemataceae bacterium]